MVKSLGTKWHLVLNFFLWSLIEWSKPFNLRPSEYRTSKVHYSDKFVIQMFAIQIPTVHLKSACKDLPGGLPSSQNHPRDPIFFFQDN